MQVRGVATYMESSVGTDEGERIAHHTNHKGDALGLPAAIVDPRSEDFGCVAVRAKRD